MGACARTERYQCKTKTRSGLQKINTFAFCQQSVHQKGGSCSFCQLKVRRVLNNSSLALVEIRFLSRISTPVLWLAFLQIKLI